MLLPPYVRRSHKSEATGTEPMTPRTIINLPSFKLIMSHISYSRKLMHVLYQVKLVSVFKTAR